jgi:glutamine synthetase
MSYIKLVSEKLTKQDIKSLKCSWSDWKTHANGKAEVARKANALAKRMNGKGWQPHVSENLGWHYEVYNGTLHVHPNDDGTYWCLFAKDTKYWGVGECFWDDDNRSYKDPNEAVEAQLKLAQDFVNECQTAINKVRDNIEAI